MPPDRPNFGGGAAATILHPAVLLAVMVAIALIYVLPRRYMVVAVLACALLMPRADQLVIGGLHFFILRVLIICGWGRVLLQRAAGSARLPWTGVDTTFMAWAVCKAAAVIILYHSWEAVNNQAAFLLDALGGYYLLRHLITTDATVRLVIRTLGVIAAVLGSCMLYEHYYGINVFGVIGGAPTTAAVRDGVFRAQGVFAHSLIAGAFGATAIPLLIWLLRAGRNRLLTVLSLAGAVAMVISASGSTPMLVCAAAAVAFGAWRLRERMRQVRWAAASMLVVLQCVMNAPVWFLIARIDLTGSSSSYGRAVLVDTCIRRIGDWWLVGTTQAAEFGYDMWDLCNQYVAEAETGGLLTLVFFILTIGLCFRRLGLARRAARRSPREWFLWCLGVALFSHVVGFIGISYFDQMQIVWYALLAGIVAATEDRGCRSPASENMGPDASQVPDLSRVSIA